MFSGFNFTAAYVVCITAMINHVFISFSVVQIYDLSYIRLQCEHMFANRSVRQQFADCFFVPFAHELEFGNTSLPT